MRIFAGILIVIIWPRSLHDGFQAEKMIVWDVGQGQWISYISEEFCHHFDVGGEKFPSHVIEECLGKVNQLSLSHWDFDHISFLFRAKKMGLELCISDLPTGHHKWKNSVSSWPKCRTGSWTETFVPQKNPNTSKRKGRNDQSLVFKIASILITGDAPSRVEKRLYRRFDLEDVQYLVVGHHGSITSSSEVFLRGLKQLQLAFVSARRGKYGHPHPIVVSRFRRLRIPLISTDDWGHIVVELR